MTMPAYNACARWALDSEEATLESWTPRKERHGEDRVSAFSARFSITTGNPILDTLDPDLRPAIYRANAEQDDLPGVEQTTPRLVTRSVERLSLRACYEGWTLRIERGAADTMVFSGCKVDKFTVQPAEGGSVTLSFRVGTNDVSQDEAGWLFSHMGDALTISLEPPEDTGAAIDGTQEAYERDHPPVDEDARPTAEDLFAAGEPLH